MFDEETRRPYYFNGRVLTAEALQDEQDVQEERLEDLGQVVGEGVVEGLGVRASSAEPPVTAVDVKQGTALARSGAILRLGRPITVELTPSEESTRSASGSEFTVCATGSEGETVRSGGGLYLVTLAPAEKKEGRAPRVGLEEGEASDCARQYIVNGVTVRLRQASELFVESALRSAKTAAVERNLIAHMTLGSFRSEERSSELASVFAEARSALLDPAVSFDPPGGRDPLNRLREQGILPDHEVPLALLQWGEEGVSFVDVWAVRRRVHTPSRASLAQMPVEADRRAVGEAALRQFETHLADDDLSGVDVFGSFRFLPAAGLLELSETQASSCFEAVRTFLSSKREVDRLASLLKGPRNGEEGGAARIQALRRYFQEFGAWTAYDNALEDTESELRGEIDSAKRHVEFLEDGSATAEEEVENLFSPFQEGLGGTFLKAAKKMGESGVELRMALPLPWWMIDVDVTLLDGAQVGPLFERSFRQPAISIPQLSLERLRERIVEGKATRADLGRKLRPAIQLHLVRESLPTEVSQFRDTLPDDQEEIEGESEHAFLLFSRHSTSVSLARVPRPWLFSDTLEQWTGTEEAVYETTHRLSGWQIEESGRRFVAEEVEKLKDELEISEQKAKLLFDRFGVRSLRDLRDVDRRVLRDTLKLGREEMSSLFRRFRRF